MEYLRTNGTYINTPRWIFEGITFIRKGAEEETSMKAIFGDFDPPDHDTLDYFLYRCGIKTTDGMRALVTFSGTGEAYNDNKGRRYTAEKVYPSEAWRIIEEEVIE